VRGKSGRLTIWGKAVKRPLQRPKRGISGRHLRGKVSIAVGCRALTSVDKRPDEGRAGIARHRVRKHERPVGLGANGAGITTCGLGDR